MMDQDNDRKINMYELQCVLLCTLSNGQRYRTNRTFNVITTAPGRAIELVLASDPDVEEVINVIRRNGGAFITDPLVGLPGPSS